MAAWPVLINYLLLIGATIIDQLIPYDPSEIVVLDDGAYTQTGGQPLAGQLQPAVFSPFTWILLAAPPDATPKARAKNAGTLLADVYPCRIVIVDGVSLWHRFHELEREGLLESRPRAGTRCLHRLRVHASYRPNPGRG